MRGLGTGEPPHRAVLSVAGGGRRAPGPWGTGSGRGELRGTGGQQETGQDEGCEARAPPPPGQGEQPVLRAEGGMPSGGTVSPGLGCGPRKPQGFTWKVPEPLESVVRRGTRGPSWQTQADSRRLCSGAPGLQAEGCGALGAGWAEAVRL